MFRRVVEESVEKPLDEERKGRTLDQTLASDHSSEILLKRFLRNEDMVKTELRVPMLNQKYSQ
jgi:hypothetical protein